MSDLHAAGNSAKACTCVSPLDAALPTILDEWSANRKLSRNGFEEISGDVLEADL